MVSVENYTIMPNHIHLLLLIKNSMRSTLCSPTISIVVKNLKEFTTKQTGKAFWQKSFHDHIIRDKRDYARIWQYIEDNHRRWEKDCFYIEQ